METTSQSESQERRIGPTVSRDKWLNHARNKLSRGYVLIVGTERKTANFHSSEKGYEMCSYQVARQLIKDGTLVKVREHHLGDVYELREPPELSARGRRAAPVPAADEFDGFLDEIDEETGDAAGTD